ncbi:hypothetical protein BaRGS_00027150 [Batillaria attramentaria]|uniref:Uncharacterized protein n=1 Tax=Batillaria attramentaria TaxID=370345 RepID=A0ABD0K3L6_9CAEN
MFLPCAELKRTLKIEAAQFQFGDCKAEEFYFGASATSKVSQIPVDVVELQADACRTELQARRGQRPD